MLEPAGDHPGPAGNHPGRSGDQPVIGWYGKVDGMVRKGGGKESCQNWLNYLKT